MESAIFSLGDNLRHPISGELLTESERHQQLIRYSVWASESGFDAVHIGEHHFNDYMLSSPPVVLSAIGQQVPDLILSTAVTLVPTLDPVRAAEDYSTLENLFPGRVEIVAGRGNFFSRSYPAFGLDVTNARAIFDEKLALLQRLLREENISWAGEFREPLDDITVRPRPTDEIPLWIGAGSTTSALLAAKLGCRLMLPSVFGHPKMFVPIIEQYREAWHDAGRSEEDIVIGSCCHAFAGTSHADMRERFTPRYDHYWTFVDQLISDNTGGKVQMPFDLESFLAGPAVAGSSQECVDRMAELHELLGHNRQLFMFDLGGVSDSELEETVRRFGEEVLPHLPS
ncbi:MAG TPA: LLM class flavin-dependent oxidoreductase [Acidimicrobiaceae bacterium]|nr:LLM class flavin-dependent oxidoreductase [Acidimicrobiaceae bacterium]